MATQRSSKEKNSKSTEFLAPKLSIYVSWHFFYAHTSISLFPKLQSYDTYCFIVWFFFLLNNISGIVAHIHKCSSIVYIFTPGKMASHTVHHRVLTQSLVRHWLELVPGFWFAFLFHLPFFFHSWIYSIPKVTWPLKTGFRLSYNKIPALWPHII